MTEAHGPTVIVVPCFNEERRIDERAFLAVASTGLVRLLFVDDGSTDGTGRLLARLADASEAVEVLTMTENAGKAEAVRNGLLGAVRAGAAYVGYYDADMATPPEELLRLTRTLHARADLVGVLGSRVARLGSTIERGAVRHYLGRAYATVASMALGITVYDTQCGAKVFRVNDTFVASLAEPFRSSWALDVELLHRLLRGSAGAPGLPVTSFEEVPLERWRDVPGSKMRIGAAVSALLDLAVIARSRIRHASDDVGPSSKSSPRSTGEDPHRARA
ncbi:MAG TPA: glycosyltransferase [Acidimicrobiales bacterium]|nr:glycosyltransferase [Acidimicrobiales bacterium]